MNRITSKLPYGNTPKIPENKMTMGYIWKRLNEIEDILGDHYDLTRLQQVMFAEQQGRFLILPCKIGDKIYRIETEKVALYLLGEHQIPYEVIEGSKEIIEDSFSLSDIDEFGKTVFLSREDAVRESMGG